MCGIIGIIGTEAVAPAILEGLSRLAYRGYDSAGIATGANGIIHRVRAQGKLARLGEKIASPPLAGTVGIGHTRWATHGAPNETNAHPHATSRVAVVHNGIIENYAALKSGLEADGVRFESETDTEVVVHLLSRALEAGQTPKEAAQAVFARLEGAYALVVLFAGHEDILIGVRQGTPLALGYGDGEMFLASDSYALAPLTQKVCFLDDGDRVFVTRTGAEIVGSDGTPRTRAVRLTAQSGAVTGKGAFRHFMLKEIHEQPAVIGDTLNSFINPATGRVALPPEIMEALAGAPRITLVACGTAFYACMLAKYWLERIARVPCEVDIASEFRYREPPLPDGGVAIFVTQSGETLDTLEALRYCRRQGQKILCIVNTIESTIERESDFVLHTLAGPEIGVASTKAFTTQIATLACLAVGLARTKGTIDAAEESRLSAELRRLPAAIADVLALEPRLAEVARAVMGARDMLYLGRGGLYPLALEGALKLKEVSYIHAEGYAAGEMKHGPIALVDEHVPVVVLAPGNDPLFSKTASNVQETVARGGKIVLFSDAQGAAALGSIAQWTVVLNDVSSFVAPILYALPVQMLAYHVAIEKGTDVDQPRNLAKSVTVE